jgi:predicted ribosomally synthesized peptide with nif11-like leader
MGMNSAKLFVKRMREDNIFREQVSGVKDKEAFWNLVKKKNFDFDERHLAGAMAACMTEMENAAVWE